MLNGRWLFSILAFFLALGFTALTGCRSTNQKRSLIDQTSPTGPSSRKSDQGSELPNQDNKDSKDPDEDDGRLIITENPDPADANACTPAVDFFAQRAYTVPLDAKRVLWIFAGVEPAKSTAVSTCVDGKFALTFLRPLVQAFETPGQPWISGGKIYAPFATGEATVVVMISNFEASPQGWRIEKKSLALPHLIVGAVVISPHVLLFVEPEPQKLSLQKIGEDLTGELKSVDATFPAQVVRGLSIRADIATGKWLAIYSSFDGTAVARATDIKGPWSEPKIAHTDKDGLACNEATDLPMFTATPNEEAVIAYSCADAATLKFARFPLPKD